MQRKHRRRIMGVETEYGILLPEGGKFEDLMEDLGLRAPRFNNWNGCRLYVDHERNLEYCTPEEKSYRRVIIQDKAGEIISRQLLPKEYNAVLVKNNVDKDFKGKNKSRELNTFGCHENYLVNIKSKKLFYSIMPFLVARTAMIGAGFLDEEGNYFLSQREKFIRHPKSMNTVNERGIINTGRKDEPLTKDKNKFRFHLICADANMCEVANALKFGATDLMICLIEDNMFPDIQYNNEMSVRDLRTVNSQTSDWNLEGMIKGPEYVVDFLNLCEDTARQAYYGYDSETDFLLDIWKGVNGGLASINSDPYYLVGKLDWVTKRFLLEEFAQRDSLDFEDMRIQSNDIQYHRTDDDSLFYQAQKGGLIERVITDEEILEAVNYPPTDTRANFRGRAVKLFEYYQKKYGKNGLDLLINWDGISLCDVNANISLLWSREISNPYDTYEEYFADFSHILEKHFSRK